MTKEESPAWLQNHQALKPVLGDVELSSALDGVCVILGKGLGPPGHDFPSVSGKNVLFCRCLVH